MFNVYVDASVSVEEPTGRKPVEDYMDERYQLCTWSSA